MKCVIDIETSEIPKFGKDYVKEIFCIAVKIDDKETKCFTKEPIENSSGSLSEALKLINQCDEVIGHNIIKFDLPIIERLLGKVKPKPIDTLILSALCYSVEELTAIDYSIKDFPTKLLGSRSLKAFGERFRDFKLNYDDFTHLNKEMVIYCIQDVDLTYRLYKNLIKKRPLDKASFVEFEFASIIAKQESFGFYFDIDTARKLAVKKQFKLNNLKHKLQKIFPPIFVPDGNVVSSVKPRKQKVYVKVYKNIPLGLKPFKFPLKAYRTPRKIIDPITGIQQTLVYKIYSGKFFTTPHNLIYSYTDGDYQKIKLERFNPNSRQQIIKRLETLGWKSNSYTEKGNPQLNENVLNYNIERI